MAWIVVGTLFCIFSNILLRREYNEESNNDSPNILCGLTLFAKYLFLAWSTMLLTALLSLTNKSISYSWLALVRISVAAISGAISNLSIFCSHSLRGL